MPKFTVERSILIASSASQIKNYIMDFSQWRSWSPWLITEPETEVTVAEDGKSYTWKGNRTGEGKMRRLSDNDSEITYQLNFIKPWKSQSAVAFRFQSEGGKTRVFWKMDGSLPFFMFFMKKLMINWMNMDYDRGLNMLKDQMETGSVPSKIEFSGETRFEGTPYVGKKTECRISELGPCMEKDFQQLKSWMESSEINPKAEPFSVYHKWDLGKGKVIYTSGIPVEKAPSNIPSEFISGELPATKAYCLKHVGPYRHLGNVWSTGMSMARSKTFQQNKNLPPFETYPSDPAQVAENDLETRVYFPVK